MLIRVTATPLAARVAALPRVVKLESALGGRGMVGPASWAPAVQWASDVDFVAGPPASTVTHNNGFYIALQDSRGVPPGSDESIWQLIVAGVSAGSLRIVTLTNNDHTCQNAIDEVVLAIGPCTITLPDPNGNVSRYTVKRIGGGVVSVVSLGGANIEGEASIPDIGLVGTALDFIGDSSDYYII